MTETTMIIIVIVFIVIGRVAGFFAWRAVRRNWSNFRYYLFEAIGLWVS